MAIMNEYPMYDFVRHLNYFFSSPAVLQGIEQSSGKRSVAKELLEVRTALANLQKIWLANGMPKMGGSLGQEMGILNPQQEMKMNPFNLMNVMISDKPPIFQAQMQAQKP